MGANKQRVIGIDTDEVLAVLFPNLLRYMNPIFGKNFSMKDMWSYKVWEVYGVPLEEMMPHVLAFHKTDAIRHAPIIEGAVGGVAELVRRGHKLVGITGRPEFTRDDTEAWLRKGFNGAFEGLYYAKSLFGGHLPTKADICLREGVDTLVDDSPIFTSEHNPLVHHGLQILFYDHNGEYQWGKGVKNSRHVKRVHSWKEIVREID